MSYSYSFVPISSDSDSNSHQNIDINIVLASKDPLKLIIVRECFQTTYPNRQIIINTCTINKSVVQSVDHGLLYHTRLRLNHARRMYPRADIIVAIETGLDLTLNLDFACVFIESHGHIVSNYSLAMLIPEKYISKLQSIPIYKSSKYGIHIKQSLGDIIHQIDPHIPSDNWETYYGLDRKVQLSEVLNQSITNLYESLDAIATHFEINTSEIFTLLKIPHYADKFVDLLVQRLHGLVFDTIIGLDPAGLLIGFYVMKAFNHRANRYHTDHTQVTFRPYDSTPSTSRTVIITNTITNLRTCCLNTNIVEIIFLRDTTNFDQIRDLLNKYSYTIILHDT